MAVIRYGQSADAWREFDATLRALITAQGLTRVCEIGGGANPALPRDFLGRHRVDYTVLDVSATELDKAPPGYRTVVGDIADPGVAGHGPFDLVFSKMLAEHVRDGRAFYRNVRALLADGGWALHFFPTLYALPFVVNRIIPERLSARLLALVAPRDQVREGKFPAYYSWCRGPARAHIRRLEALDFEVVEYAGFFGHDYYQRLPLVRTLHRGLTGWLVQHPTAHWTSFAFVTLRAAA